MAHSVDVHVGRRVRELRKAARFSQTGVAEALGVSFQQVQKYERGTNRMSASKLYELSRLLNVPIGAFYAGLAGEAPSEAQRRTMDVDADAARVVEMFQGASPRIRAQILSVISALTAEPVEG